MSDNLTGLLDAWPYEPGKLNVRMISGDDNEPRIQLRLDLGVLQLRLTGRPDGQTPEGFESLLEYHEAMHDEHVEAHGSATGFTLSAEECQALRDEAVQYYHRYVCLMALEDYEGVVRDTTRNLRVLDLCAAHAGTEGDRTTLERFRAYIMMMRARAMASQSLKDNEPKAAIFAIDDGLESLRKYFEESGQMEAFDESSEVQALRGMRSALTPKLPVSQKSELKKRLEQALTAENYELAAILRDELRMLPD